MTVGATTSQPPARPRLRRRGMTVHVEPLGVRARVSPMNVRTDWIGKVAGCRRMQREACQAGLDRGIVAVVTALLERRSAAPAAARSSPGSGRAETSSRRSRRPADASSADRGVDLRRGRTRRSPGPGRSPTGRRATRTGNEEIRPSGTPYEPSDTIATDVQSPSGVPLTQSWTWSIAAFAADAAEDAPRASMIAAPRLATVGMNSSRSQASSTCSAAILPPTSAWNRSGYWVAEWLPQIVIFVISVTGTPSFFASCASARLWSRRVIAVNRSAGTSGACGLGDQRVGVGRVADHQHADVVRGARVDRLALRREDAAVGLEQVAALHALGPRAGADQQRDVDAVEGARSRRR